MIKRVHPDDFTQVRAVCEFGAPDQAESSPDHPAIAEGSEL